MLDETIIVTIDGQDYDLSEETLPSDANLRSATLVSNSTLFSDSFIRELLLGVSSVDELAELLEKLNNSSILPVDFDMLNERYTAVELAEDIEHTELYADVNDWADGHTDTLFDGIERDTLDRLLPFLDIDGYVARTIADDEYVYILSDGAILDTSQL